MRSKLVFATVFEKRLEIAKLHRLDSAGTIASRRQRRCYQQSCGRIFRIIFMRTPQTASPIEPDTYHAVTAPDLLLVKAGEGQDIQADDSARTSRRTGYTDCIAFEGRSGCGRVYDMLRRSRGVLSCLGRLRVRRVGGVRTSRRQAY